MGPVDPADPLPRDRAYGHFFESTAEGVFGRFWQTWTVAVAESNWLVTRGASEKHMVQMNAAVIRNRARGAIQKRTNFPLVCDV